jgi:hypothetical protein
MACNAYRRIHGSWPEAVRFAPEHFAYMAAETPPEGLIVLAHALDVHVSASERSPRLTVSGPHGALTYDHGVEEADHDTEPFDEWLASEANRLGLAAASDDGR